MKALYKILSLALFASVCIVPGAFCFDLKGNVSVNRVSDTASDAKNEAMNWARRQILFNVLSQYTQKDYLNEALQRTSDDELMNLVSSVSVSNEQISSKAYSANVAMNLDNDLIKRWLNEQGVKNWIPSSKESDEKFTAFIVVQHGVSDWAELKRIARNDNVDIETQSIVGNQIFIKLPLNYRSKFTAEIHKEGWRYIDNNGVLQVWK